MPLYSDGVLDEVRNSVNLVSLISEYVALKKRGRNYVARCPFHTEKTPSFNVSEEKQIFRCFGCGVGGDIFKFVMQVEQLSFPEAVRFIAERHGIVLPQPAARPESESGSDTETLRRVMEEAGLFFHQTLLEQEEGRSPLEYLQGRGVTRQSIDRFSLGYAPAGGGDLLAKFQRKGFSVSILEECGLIKRSEDGTRHYDAFRGRIMFPIADIRGRVIAFGGRALGDRQPKYLNSPETRLYNKSRNLYGLTYARSGIQKLDYAVLVEGYMDFLIPFQHGIENVVASLGTSLTQQQVKLLGRYTREVVVSYDPDSAGLAATQRSLDLFLEEDFRVRVFRLPEGQDPDAFVRSAGANEYMERLGRSTPYLDFVLDSAMQRQGKLGDPKSKIQVMNAVLPYLAKIPNAVERSDYVFRFARRLQVEDQQLLAEVKRAAQQKKTRLPEAPLATVGVMKFAEKRLLQLLLGDPVLQQHILSACSVQDFAGLAAERIFAALLECFERGESGTFEGLHRRFAGQEEQVMLAQLQMEDVPEDLSRETAESFLSALRSIRLASRRQEILSRIAEAAERNDDEMLNKLIEARVQVDRELVSLSRK
ncbi:MAG: primase [Acidobacteria bacterium]|nr:primase [Acidobacteriota bacterium]